VESNRDGEVAGATTDPVTTHEDYQLARFGDDEDSRKRLSGAGSPQMVGNKETEGSQLANEERKTIPETVPDLRDSTNVTMRDPLITNKQVMAVSVGDSEPGASP